MNKTEQAVNEILESIPELNDGKINNVQLLVGLGFEPLPPRTGCGAFFEWYKELKIGISTWKVNVILEKEKADVRAFNLIDGRRYFYADCDLMTALKAVLTKCKEN